MVVYPRRALHRRLAAAPGSALRRRPAASCRSRRRSGSAPAAPRACRGRRSAPVQHQDLVGIAHGADALGDHEGGAALHQLVERLLDLVLGLGVHAAGRVVQDQDARVEQQRAGDRDALLLAAARGWSRARRPACRSPAGSCTMKSCAAAARAAASTSSWAGIRAAEGDVVADRAAEQGRLLQHDADLRAQALERHVAHVVAVDQHAPGGDVVEARDQVDDRGLAAAGGAEQGDRLARARP